MTTARMLMAMTITRARIEIMVRVDVSGIPPVTVVESGVESVLMV